MGSVGVRAQISTWGCSGRTEKHPSFFKDVRDDLVGRDEMVNFESRAKGFHLAQFTEQIMAQCKEGKEQE